MFHHSVTVTHTDLGDAENLGGRNVECLGRCNKLVVAGLPRAGPVKVGVRLAVGVLVRNPDVNGVRRIPLQEASRNSPGGRATVLHLADGVGAALVLSIAVSLESRGLGVARVLICGNVKPCVQLINVSWVT